MLNEDGSINSPESPPSLAIVQLFATGVGALTSKSIDGLPARTFKRPVAPMRILIESQEAEILYDGSAPGLVEGAVQINCRLPTALPGRGGDSAFIRIQAGDSQRGEFLFYFEE